MKIRKEIIMQSPRIFNLKFPIVHASENSYKAINTKRYNLPNLWDKMGQHSFPEMVTK